MENLSKEVLETLAVDIYDNVFEMEIGDPDVRDLLCEFSGEIFGEYDFECLNDEDQDKCSNDFDDLLKRSIKEVYGDEMVIEMV
jgi:hypothetical protein